VIVSTVTVSGGPVVGREAIGGKVLMGLRTEIVIEDALAGVLEEAGSGDGDDVEDD